MATYTINTTIQQDTIIAKVLIAINKDRTAQGLPLIGLIQLVQRFFLDNIESHKRNQDDQTSLTLFVAYDIATPVQQQNIKTILGIL